MKKLILVLALVFSSLALAQAPGPNVNSGRFMAANYGQWQVQVQSSSASKACVSPTNVVLADGSKLNPWNTNASILIGSGANVETVTPTSFDFVSTPGQVCISATYIKTHFFGDTVSSGTFGLQEALNAAGVKGGGAVTIDQNWTALGGTTAIKNAASLPSNVLIEDARAGVSGGTSGSTGQATGSVFTIGNTSCGTTPNCLQWVDDDSTDNCGASTTTFMVNVNAYAGQGIPQVNIFGSSTGKAYKLSTCNLVFSNTQGVHINLQGSIDCAMALQSCIQFGATSTSGGAGSNATALQSFRIDGGGALIGGHSLTGSGGNGSGVGGGVYVMPHISGTVIDGISFGGTGANLGFGVNSAFGSCSTYAIMFDNPLPDGVVMNVVASINSNGVTTGACGFGNPGGASSGSNTIMFDNNIIFTDGEASGVGQCGSVGINDGGTLGHMNGNNIFGFGIPILVSGIGHRLTGNQIDSTQCAAGGVSAAIQVGGTGSVGPVGIMNNIVQLAVNHAARLIDIKNGATPTLTGWTIIGNLNNSTTNPLVNLNITCTPLGNQSSCYSSGNQNMSPPLACASSSPTSNGWQSGPALAQCFPGQQTANLGATNLLLTGFIPGTPALGVTCEVIISQAATTSSTLPVCNVTFKDAITGTTVTAQITPAWAANTAGCIGSTTNTVGNSCSGTVFINANGNTTITYSTTGYASTGATPMGYQTLIEAFRVER